MTGKSKPLCLTQGDPSGIGPDIALALYAAMRVGGVAIEPFFLLADPDFLRRRAKMLNIDVEIVETTPEQAGAAFSAGLPVAPLRAQVAGAPGRPDPGDALATIEAISRAVELVAQGHASAVVTNPIAKSVLYQAGFAHPGHTEFLGELADRYFGGSRAFSSEVDSGSRGENAAKQETGAPIRSDRIGKGSSRPTMLLWSRELAVVPATIHVPLARVPSLLNIDDLVEIGAIVAEAFSRDFGVSAPRLVFAGLNPHAGENGAIGREDIEIVAPAVARLAARGINAKGPFSADTLFHAQARKIYDVAICMYHDQALIPIKTLAFDSGVNVTLGLPFIRTSPDHGTAFDLAGTGRASAKSLTEALLLAGRMARART